MTCYVCEKRGLQQRRAQYNVIGLTGSREGWALPVCHYHVRRYRTNKAYHIQTTVLEALLESVPPIITAGMIMGVFAQIAGRIIGTQADGTPQVEPKGAQ